MTAEIHIIISLGKNASLLKDNPTNNTCKERCSTHNEKIWIHFKASTRDYCGRFSLPSCYT